MHHHPLSCRALGLALALWSAAPVAATPVDVANPVYAFLRRLEIEGRITPGYLNTLPATRSEVRRLLDEAEIHSESLPPWERGRLLSFRQEFGLAESTEGRYHPIAYRDSSFEARAGADFCSDVLVEDSLPKANTYGFGLLSATVEGSYKEKLQFLSNVGLGQQRSLRPRFTENYDPAQGMPYNTDRAGKAGIPRTVSSMDAFRTVAGYEEKSLRIELGTDWNQWGPGIWQHAFLSQRPWFWVQDSLPASDSVGFPGTPHPGRYRLGYRSPGEAAPMTQLRMAVRFGPFAYIKVVAERTGLEADSLAHLIAHRLEYRPWSFLGLGIEELVATAGRPLDWTYVIPLVPIKYAEHQLGDRDNIAIGFDAEALLDRRFRLFGEFLLDDFSGWDLNFWGDKYAFSLGGEATGFPFAASLLQVEYARVEPWVFTHHLHGTQLQSFGSLLGSSIPADSHVLHAAWEQPLRENLDMRIEYAFMQRDVTARGSGLFDFHEDVIDGTQKVFLGGTVETRNTFMAGATYRWRRFVELHGEAGYMVVDNWKSQAGESLATPLFALETLLHY